MYYLDKLAKDIKNKQKKQKINSIQNYAVFTVLGVAIVGTVAAIFSQSCCEKIRNFSIMNKEDIDEETNKETDEEINIKRDEIKQTLKNVNDESVGDVGSAMEKALEDLEDEKQNENETTK
ncbi:MAG: hypothetical protein ACI8WT_000992 [Clostridium sp.]|jgi:hypothetical protein